MAKWVKKIYNTLLGDDTAEAEQTVEEEAVIADEDTAGEELQTKAAEETPVQGSHKALEMKVVRPVSYDGNIMKIAEHLLKKRTVVLNLEATTKEASRRIVDFLTGVTFAINGQIKPIANNIFIITPSNVDVTSDKLQEAVRTQTPEPVGDASGYSEF